MLDNPTLETIDAFADHLRGRFPEVPKVALTIGSGLGNFVNHVEILEEVPFGEIPGFVASTVEGHRGSIILANCDGVKAILLAGRKHVYEGLPVAKTVLPIRAFARMGIENLILSNAAGGVNRTFSVGDLMLIEDHINWQFVNPLIGPNIDEMGDRWPDMCDCWDPGLRALAKEVAAEQKIPLREGTYLAGTGPTYETVAEREMLRMFGADAVGMSTVPENITAVHAGMKVLGITFVSNMLVGPEAGAEVTHAEVLENAAKVEKRFEGLILGILKKVAA